MGLRRIRLGVFLQQEPQGQALRAAGDALVLEFDQAVQWNDKLASEFYLDGEKGRVASGSASGSMVMLKLKGPSKAKTLTYLDSANWSQERLLRGENGLAALTFCEVPIEPYQEAK